MFTNKNVLLRVNVIKIAITIRWNGLMIQSMANEARKMNP